MHTKPSKLGGMLESCQNSKLYYVQRLTNKAEWWEYQAKLVKTLTVIYQMHTKQTLKALTCIKNYK